MKYIIIGLGNFGKTLAITLNDMGHEVIGVDSEEKHINEVKEYLTYVVCMDATHQENLQNLPLDSSDAVIVTIGEHTGNSIMTTALLRQAGVENIICRTNSDLHKTVLETMGIKEIIHPEYEAAHQLASRLEFKEMLTSYSLTDEYKIAEVECTRKIEGHSIEELSLPATYDLLILTIMRKKNKKNLLGIGRPVRQVLGIVEPDLVLEPDDNLVLFGSQKNIKKFVDYLSD